MPWCPKKEIYNHAELKFGVPRRSQVFQKRNPEPCRTKVRRSQTFPSVPKREIQNHAELKFGVPKKKKSQQKNKVPKRSQAFPKGKNCADLKTACLRCSKREIQNHAELKFGVPKRSQAFLGVLKREIGFPHHLSNQRWSL